MGSIRGATAWRKVLLQGAAAAGLAASHVAHAQTADSVTTENPTTLQRTNPATMKQDDKKNGSRKKLRESAFSDLASDNQIEDLGLFYGFATINGREVSSGGNWRVVNFKQFPSELTKATTTQRFQRADQIEGAIFGTLETRTVRPLDLKGRRFQAELRGSYLPYGDRFGSGIGKRATASYVDQFDTGIGRIGVSIGVLVRHAPQPREYFEAGTNYRPCNSVDPGSAAGLPATTGTCNYNPASGNRLYYATPAGTFRQERVTEKLNGEFGALQWQPNARLDINFDVERSRRITSRYRDELGMTDTSSGIAPLEIGSDGQLIKWAGETGLDLNAFTRRRDETYTGGGLTTRYQASDRLTLQADLSYSNTYRVQNDTSATLTANDGIGPGGRIGYIIDQSNGSFPKVTFGSPVDLNDYSLFSLNPSARRGYETRTDRIWAGRLDATYQSDGAINVIKVGLRYSDHVRDAQLNTYTATGAGIDPADVNYGLNNCRISGIVDDWGSQTDTNIQHWAMFDPNCLFAAYAGTDDPNTTLKNLTGAGINVRERILAGYAMASFEGGIAGASVTGNFGLRVVRTETDTLVYRFTGTGTGNPAEVRSTVGPIIDLLPSASISISPTQRFWIRAGISRTLQRSNIEGLGLRRIQQGPAADFERKRPTRAWNADIFLEYNLSRDTAFTAAFNYKLVSGAIWPGDTLIPGGPTLPAWLLEANRKGSYIRGFEVGAKQALRFLPKPIDGLTIYGSYAFTDSNFKFADPTAIDPNYPMYLFTIAAGVPALSKHVLLAGADLDVGKLSLGVKFHHRSAFFRPTGLTPNRYLAPGDFLSVNASYDISPHFQVLALAANLLNQSESYVRPVADSVGQTAFTGRVFSAALRIRY